VIQLFEKHFLPKELVNAMQHIGSLTLSNSHNNHIALSSSLLIRAFLNSLLDLNWPVMASHSWSRDPPKEWMIGLTTESHTIYWIQPFQILCRISIDQLRQVTQGAKIQRKNEWSGYKQRERWQQWRADNWKPHNQLNPAFSNSFLCWISIDQLWQNHSGSGDPTKEWMIGLQTERAAAIVTEDSTEEKAVARARMDVVTDAVTSICKLVTV
jgi:hypothetical protein